MDQFENTVDLAFKNNISPYFGVDFCSICLSRGVQRLSPGKLTSNEFISRWAESLYRSLKRVPQQAASLHAHLRQCIQAGQPAFSADPMFNHACG